MRVQLDLDKELIKDLDNIRNGFRLKRSQVINKMKPLFNDKKIIQLIKEGKL